MALIVATFWKQQMTMRARQKDRHATNPAFSTRRLKLGTFQTNLD